jgi:hypothetical protein
MLLFWLLSCILAIAILSDTAATATASTSSLTAELKQCLDSQMEGKRYRTKNLDDMFSMHYGDPAVETFYAVNSHDIKQIEHLSNCIASKDASQFQAKSEAHIYLGSSVTKMDNHFETLLPQVMDKIKLAIKDASVESEWNIPVDSLKLHTADYVDYMSTIPKKPYEAPVFKKVREFAIGGAKELTDEEQAIEDANVESGSDKVLMESLRRVPDDKLTVLLQLNERSDHEGGSILVKRYKAHQEEKGMLIMSDELEEDETEEETSTALSRRVLKGGMEVYEDLDKGHKLDHKYNPMSSKIRRYPLDKFQVLVLQLGSYIGMEHISEGRKIFCKFEFSF